MKPIEAAKVRLHNKEAAIKQNQLMDVYEKFINESHFHPLHPKIQEHGGLKKYTEAMRFAQVCVDSVWYKWVRGWRGEQPKSKITVDTTYLLQGIPDVE